MAARLRTGTAAGDRAADGLDQLRRHEAAAHPSLRHQGGRCGVLRTRGHPLSGVRTEGASPPANRLRRQFCVPARRALDPLSVGVGTLAAISWEVFWPPEVRKFWVA